MAKKKEKKRDRENERERRKKRVKDRCTVHHYNKTEAIEVDRVGWGKGESAGLLVLTSLARGALHLLKWDKAEAYVSLLRTYGMKKNIIVWNEKEYNRME